MIRSIFLISDPHLPLSSISAEKYIPSSNLLQELKKMVYIRAGCCDHYSPVSYTGHVLTTWSGACILFWREGIYSTCMSTAAEFTISLWSLIIQ